MSVGPPTLTHILARERGVVEAGREPAPSQAQTRQWFEAEPLWFKRSVFYEIHVRGFYDGNGDGSGDFRGLTEKLDYLQWLGIDCIWLLPFYRSPLRDGGYDIADFTNVHSDYGTVEDVRELIDAAHARRIRVIADLVMNHTSTDHPWFQESRSSPRSAKRDWYVWSDTDERYKDARIIFIDTEHSNWSWDPVAGAYYWHRFFSHQPDLNYDNPEVQDAMIEILRFWLDLGLDGFHLSGVPYLYEREGTNCENLPESRAYVRRVAEMLARAYRDRVLMMDAVDWNETVPDYGDGTNAIVLRHVSFAPRLFFAIRRESRDGVYEVLRRPSSLLSTQLAFYLRDHDELPLATLDEDERDYMFAEYANDPRMKLNLGIRRRLACLLDSGRDELELAFSLLMTMPGSPIIYYGDELGMGDNYFLADRDGLRTPMQWTGDRNAGFSRADWRQLYAEPLMDPVYGFQALNVEAQLRTNRSLVRWIHRLIAVRKEHPVLAFGDILPLYPSNPHIVAFVRSFEDDQVLVVANLSRAPQPTDLDLSRWQLRTPVELFGWVTFPPIEGGPYRLTLGPRGFLLFQLVLPE